jgi:protein SCO1/2
VKKPERSAGRRGRHILITLIALAALSAGDRQGCAQGFTDNQNVIRNDGVPRQLQNVTVEQNLGGKIPTNLPLMDSSGKPIKTGYFIDGSKPTIITLNYSSCPMLCSVQLNQLAQSLRQLDMKLGKDFRILTVSIDPRETTATAAETKRNYVELLQQEQSLAEQGWSFCTASQPIITELADLLGFRYRYDRVSGEYFHPAMAAYISPDGVITRYSLDVGFEPKDMRIALVEAGNGTVGNVVDQFILWCSNFDPDRNSYVPQAWMIMKLSGAAMVGLMLACLMPYWIGRRSLPALTPSEDSGYQSESSTADEPTNS